jgi:hypothetical protein
MVRRADKYGKCGTVLDRKMKPLFKGTDHEILDWIMANPVSPCSVWPADEYAPMSIDEWMDGWEQ